MDSIGNPVSRREVLRGVGVVLATPLLEQAGLSSALAETTGRPASAEPGTNAGVYRGKWHDKSRCFGFQEATENQAGSVAQHSV